MAFNIFIFYSSVQFNSMSISLIENFERFMNPNAFSHTKLFQNSLTTLAHLIIRHLIFLFMIFITAFNVLVDI